MGLFPAIQLSRALDRNDDDEAAQAARAARRHGAAMADYADKPHRVPIETIRRVLSALGFACDTADAIANSTHRLEFARCRR